ncbi:MAG: gliding motility-associated C-terminal domain-containing protein [Bacteroidales bacterium]|nr:gliding motility-associated C-terminal domain-containing protein [Bacteroidales bacterium]
MITASFNILTLKRFFILIVSLSFAGILTAQDLPDKPEIQRVTIDTSYHGQGYRVFVEWLPSTSPDVSHYILYKETPNLDFIKIDSVLFNVTGYIHVLPEPENLSYSVTAKDSSGNESLLTPGVHRAVHLKAEFDECYMRNLLSWSPYEGWDNNLSVYRIYVAEEVGPFAFLDIAKPSEIQYQHRNIEGNRSYRYLIEAVRTQDNLVSHSNIDLVETLLPEIPAYLQIDYVDVIDEASVNISVTADPESEITAFQLLRSTQFDADFLIKNTFENDYHSTFSISDHVATSGNPYFYRVDAIYQPDGCPVSRVVRSSNIGSTILLSGEENNNNVSLSWTPYRDFPGGLAGYEVSRKIEGEYVDIEYTGPGTTQFNENISSILDGPQPGEIKYRIKAIGSPNAHDPEGGESHSNEISIELETRFYMPNAFTPNGDGRNERFGPVIDFAPESFLMIIYDRAGRKLFETEDPYEGWDGRFKGGGRVIEGVYVYHVQFTEYGGRMQTQTGTVTVIYP